MGGAVRYESGRVSILPRLGCWVGWCWRLVELRENVDEEEEQDPAAYSLFIYTSPLPLTERQPATTSYRYTRIVRFSNVDTIGPLDLLS